VRRRLSTSRAFGYFYVLVATHNISAVKEQIFGVWQSGEIVERQRNSSMVEYVTWVLRIAKLLIEVRWIGVESFGFIL
jgi:hypothetical protein